MTTAWTADHVSRIAAREDGCTIPAIERIDRAGLDRDRLYWDMWPIQARDGRIAAIAGRELWMALTAPDRGDPALRHFEARIRLLERTARGWADRGDVLPRFAVPYEREWAGSAMTDGASVTLYFTAAGVADRPGGYQQRLFETRAAIGADGLPQGWSVPTAAIEQLSPEYMAADSHQGEAGKIKAFRDPAWFRDPADGQEYLIFTASHAGTTSEYNGAVGIARRSGRGWQLLPPLIHADGVNNELERAHVVYRQGRYYAFWATQSATFAPALRDAPNGLYGMVSDRLMGPYRPLNGSGLVLRNPKDNPLQSYSWFVTADLVVSSFVDMWRDGGSGELRFGGVPAPLLRLEIAGDHCALVSQAGA